ncbi:GNAT family N-acetyltransferase [Streptomyces sp. CC210A]|uniref:GNAT family N-acetyltransferase n=1 Tax=Streptomyces sp. CC210A TaxID=2898184 RepID=UPI001F342085|nr:GNAT family N-acetyltransferase [Streptomyces sp. CC210A]
MRNPSDQSEPPAPQPVHAYPDHWEADVVLRDGGTARIRPITTDDAERLVSFYEQVSDESKYYRFFAPYPRLSAKDVHHFTHHDYVDRVGLAATIGGEFIGTVRYDRIDAHGRPAAAPADEAEVAFLVQDAHQGRGVASALLEHIAACARERGIRRFAAEVLPANTKMIKVFTDAGYTQKRSFEDGAVRLHLDLEPTDRALAVQRAREQRAEARSVQRLLAPGSIAVIGAGRTPGGVGRTVLRNILESGYTGRVHAVNTALPDAPTTLDGVPAYRSVTGIGEPVDLAVVAVPADHVPSVVAECGDHGVRGLVVLSAGYAESGPAGRERQRALVRQARSYGMRVIGPNAFGILNTADDVRLNASLAPQLPAAGRIGLFTQSGAIGIALLAGLHRRGAGVSSFVSAGNRADVSGNDILQYWYEDPGTDVVLLYLESIGNPRKFTRLARRTAVAKPVVAVQGGRHSGSAPPGHAVPATRVPHATVSELLRQAGVIRVDTVTELVDVGMLLAGQPLPAGPRVAILGNSESLGLLTYDACLAEGLRPLRPRDLTTSATPDDFRAALAAALHDENCDAVVVTAIPWVGEQGSTEPQAEGEVLAEALRAASATAPAKPVVVVHVELGALADALAAATSTAPAPEPAGPAHPADPGTAAPPARANGEEPDGSAPHPPAGDRAARPDEDAPPPAPDGAPDHGTVPASEGPVPPATGGTDGGPDRATPPVHEALRPEAAPSAPGADASPSAGARCRPTRRRHRPNGPRPPDAAPPLRPGPFRRAGPRRHRTRPPTRPDVPTPRHRTLTARPPATRRPTRTAPTVPPATPAPLPAAGPPDGGRSACAPSPGSRRDSRATTAPRAVAGRTGTTRRTPTARAPRARRPTVHGPGRLDPPPQTPPGSTARRHPPPPATTARPPGAPVPSAPARSPTAPTPTGHVGPPAPGTSPPTPPPSGRSAPSPRR